MLGEYLHFVTVQKVEWRYKGGGQVPGYPGYPARCFFRMEIRRLFW